jgi:transmembrane sensor
VDPCLTLAVNFVSMRIENLFEKYLKGQASHDETRKVLKWLKSEAGQQYASERMDRDFNDLDSEKMLLGDEPNPDKMLANIFYQPETSATPAKKHGKLFLKIAASIALLTLASLAWLYYPTQQITYTTAYGEKKQIILPDNSVVTLNGNSTLRLDKKWRKNEKRNVWLTGEAFFDVIHTTNHNLFTVHTSDNFSIQVLGTEFNVLNRHDATKVELEEGRISLAIASQNGPSSSVVLKPGEVVEFDQRSSYLVKKETPIEHIASWKEEQMFFDQTSVQEISMMLENTYGLKLIIEDREILEQKISGSVPNRNIDSFLIGLAEVLNLKISREDNFIYLKKN